MRNILGCKKGMWACVIVLALGMVASEARAAVGGSDQVVVNGNILVNMPEGGPAGSEFAPAFFGPVGVQNGMVRFWEDAAQTELSDVLWTQNDFFYFASDPDLGNAPPVGTMPVLADLTETGGLQDVSQYWGLPPTSIQVVSDVEVPEPASLAVLAAGGVMLLSRRRRVA